MCIRDRPDGLAGDAIPIGARIILVSDAYDAMTTDRPYRQAIGHVRAIEELRKLSGSQFDPTVVDALLSITEDGGKEMDKVIADHFEESFIGLSLPSVDPSKTGKQYREEAERRARLAGSET